MNLQRRISIALTIGVLLMGSLCSIIFAADTDPQNINVQKSSNLNFKKKKHHQEMFLQQV